MKTLAFGSPILVAGKRVRTIGFEERSSLPTSAACLVAGSVRETLTSLLNAPVGMRLFEPLIPAPQAWPAIVAGALLYRVRGSVVDAAIVLRPGDAVALATAAFGEPHSGAACAGRALSPIEREIVDRTARAIAGSLAAVCGTRERTLVERVGSIDGFVTYFELLLEEPVAACIGIALSRDPSPEPHARLRIEDLAEIELRPVASIELGSIEAGAVARLAPGAFVPIAPSILFRASLKTSGRMLAGGSCGVRNGRYAVAIDAF
jgi:hypothetical protein